MAAFTLPYGEEGGLGQIALPNAHWEVLMAETLQAFQRVGGPRPADVLELAGELRGWG